MATPEWMPRPIGADEPQFRQSLTRAITAIKEPSGLPDVIALHHIQEVLYWIRIKGGVICAAPAHSEYSRVWNILARDPTRDWRLGIRVASGQAGKIGADLPIIDGQRQSC